MLLLLHLLHLVDLCGLAPRRYYIKKRSYRHRVGTGAGGEGEWWGWRRRRRCCTRKGNWTLTDNVLGQGSIFPKGWRNPKNADIERRIKQLCRFAAQVNLDIQEEDIQQEHPMRLYEPKRSKLPMMKFDNYWKISEGFGCAGTLETLFPDNTRIATDQCVLCCKHRSLVLELGISSELMLSRIVPIYRRQNVNRSRALQLRAGDQVARNLEEDKVTYPRNRTHTTEGISGVTSVTSLWCECLANEATTSFSDTHLRQVTQANLISAT